MARPGGALSTAAIPHAADHRGLAGRYIVWIILIPIASAMPFIMDGIMVGATETRVMRNSMFGATAAYFAIYYALRPWIGNNALWLAFTLYMLLRASPHIRHDPRLRTIREKGVDACLPDTKRPVPRSSEGPVPFRHLRPTVIAAPWHHGPSPKTAPLGASHWNASEPVFRAKICSGV